MLTTYKIGQQHCSLPVEDFVKKRDCLKGSLTKRGPKENYSTQVVVRDVRIIQIVGTHAFSSTLTKQKKKTLKVAKPNFTKISEKQWHIPPGFCSFYVYWCTHKREKEL